MPNTLDENVVILKFDNSNFKKNTEDSINALDRLKKKIKDSDSEESLSNIGKAANRIDLSGLSKSIDTINSRFSLMGIVGMSAINKLTTSAMSSVKKVATAIPNQMIQGGWKRALNIEQAEFLMEGLGVKFEGTFDKATGAMEGIKGAVLASVNETRYGLDEAAKAASTLIASDEKLKDNAELLSKRLKAISGVAAVTSSDYESISYIFTKVAGQGKMMTNELNMLSMKGFNAAVEIQRYLNTNRDLADNALDTAIALGHQSKKMEEIKTHAKLTEADIREMVSAGAIDFNIMSDSLEHFFETAAGANKTYEGSLANVKASFSRMGAVFEGAKLKNLTKVFNYLLPVLNKFEDWIKPFTEKIGEFGDKVTTFLGEGLINPIGKALGVDSKKIFHGFKDEVEQAGKASKTTGSEVKSLSDKVRVSTKEWQAALDIWNKGTYGKGQQRADAIRELGMSYEHVQGIINKFYKNDFSWDKTKAEYEVVEDLSKANKANAKSAKESGDAAQKQTKQLSGLGKVIKGVVNFTKAIINTFRAFKNIADAVWKAIKQKVMTAGYGLSGVFMDISEKVLELSKKFLEFAEAINGKNGMEEFQRRAPLLYTALQLIGKAVTFVTNIVKKSFRLISSIIHGINLGEELSYLGGALGNLATTVSKTLTSAFSKVGNKIKDFKSDVGGLSIVEKISSAFGVLIHQVGDFINGLAGNTNKIASFGGILGGFANSIIGFFEPVFTWVVDHLFAMAETIRDFFVQLGQSEGISKLKTSIQELIGSLSKTEKPLGNVTNKLSALANFTQAGSLDKIVTFFSNLAGNLADFIRAVANGKHPLESFFDVAKKTTSAFSFGGIIDFFKDFIKGRLGYFVAQEFGKGVENLVEAFRKFKNWLVEVGAVEVAMKAAKATVAVQWVVNWIKGIDWDAVLDKILSFDWDKITKIGSRIAVIVALFKTTKDMSAVAKSAAGMFKSIGGMFSSFGSIADAVKQNIKINAFSTLATSIAILIGAIVALAMLPKDRAREALISVGIIMAALTGIMTATSSKYFNPEAMKSTAIAFVGVGAGIFLIATSMLMIAKLSTDQIVKAGGVIVAFMFIITAISKRAGAMAGSGAAFLGMAVAINLLVTAVWAFALMPFMVLLKGGAIIFALMTELALAARIANSSKPGGFIAMAVALNLLIPAIAMLALMPAGMILKGGGAVVALLFALGGAARLAGNSSASLGKMAVCIALLAASCIALSFLKPEKLVTAASAISAMMLALGFAARGAKKEVGSLIIMAIIIAELAAVIIALNKLAPDKAIPIALSLAALIGVLGLVVTVMAKSHVPVGAAAKAGAAICIVILELAVTIGIIGAAMYAIGKAIEKYGGVERFADIKEKVGLVAGIIGEMLGAFAGSFANAFKNNFTSKKEKDGGMAEKIDAIKTIIESVMELTKEDFDVKKLDDLAGFFSVLAKLSSSLKDVEADEDIKTKMKAFGEGFMLLKDAVKKADPEDIEKTQLVSEILATFANASAQIATGGPNMMKDFTANLEDSGKNISTFVSALANDPVLNDTKKMSAFLGENGVLNNVIEIMKRLSTLSEGLDPSGGIKQLVEGNTTIGEFGKEMSTMSENVNSFLADFKDLKAEDLATFIDGPLAQIIRMFTVLDELGSGLDPSGGIKQLAEGNTTLGEFALDMKRMAENLRLFLGEFENGETGGIAEPLQNFVTNTLPSVVALMEALTPLAEAVPPSGGIIQWIEGKEDIGVFGSQLAQFAAGFVSLAGQVNQLEFGEGFDGKIQKMADASSILNEIAAPKDGLLKTFSKWASIGIQSAGAKRLAEAAAQLSKGDPVDIQKIQDLATASAEINKIKSPSGGVIEAIKNWAASKFDSGSLETLAKNFNRVSKYGETINMSGINKMSSAATKVSGFVRSIKKLGSIPTLGNLPTMANNISKFVKKIDKTDASGIGQKADQIVEGVSNLKNVTKVSSAVSGSSGTFKNAGSSLMKSMAKGVSGSSSEVSKAVKSIVNSAKSAVDTGALKSVGKNLGQGLASGINSSASSVRSAVEKLEALAERAVRAKAKIKSPSRVFMQLGRYIGQGFAIGIESYADTVYRAGNKLASESVRAADEVLGSMDLYGNPTITPVLDLTEVKKGASQINAMVTEDRAIAVNASVGNASRYSTPYMINDLIDKLDKANSPGNITNNDSHGTVINNITVDGAENPEEFADRLLRHIKIKTRSM